MMTLVSECHLNWRIKWGGCPRLMLVSLITLVCPSAVLSAQVDKSVTTPQIQEGQGTYVLHQRVREVLLYCTVLDQKGNLVTDLDRSAFRVTDSKQPAVIVHFSREDVPVSLALVLDDSGSMKEKRTAVEAAALDLVRESNPDDETSVTNFADRAYLDQDFTKKPEDLAKAFQLPKSVSGGTALFDTLIGAATHLSEAAHHSKQVIVVVTDGRDNASLADLAAAIRKVQTTNGPVIYTIGLLYDSSDAGRARHDLQQLSDETGGIAFFPGSVKEVDKIAAEVARDIRNQYTIAYRPPNTESVEPYHAISVYASSSGHGKLKVRTRKGYVQASTSLDH